MQLTTRLKIAAALLLVGSLALPQATCSGYRAPNGDFVYEVPEGATASEYQPMVERYYAFHDVRLRDPKTWVDVAVFLWPLPLLLIAARTRSKQWRAIVAATAPLLALFSAFHIWFSATLFVDPAIGANVALGALGGYFVASTVELRQAFR